MDQTLAAIYGTAQVTEEDAEKIAAAELAEKLAADGDVELDEETLEALANEVLEQEAAEMTEPAETAAVEEPAEKTAEEANVEEPAEKVAEATETAPELTEEQQKIAEADYLGRVMAHSFAQESREIEKEAAAYGKGEKEEHKRIARGYGRVSGVLGAVQGAAAGAMSGGSKAGRVAKAVGGAALGGAVGTGAGYALHRGLNRGARAIGGDKGMFDKKDKKEKKSSALETLIAARAAELCQENGVDPAVLTQEPEKQADAETVNPYDVLAAKVEEGAWELLKAKGLVEEQSAETTEQK